MRKRSEIGKDRAGMPLQSKLGTIECANCHLVQPTGTSDCLACGSTLPEFKVNADEPVPHESPPPMENLGKLAYDLKEKDLDITLAQLCAVSPDERRELQKWVDARSADVTPRVRMILEHLRTVKTKPLAGPGAREGDVFDKYQPTPEEVKGKLVIGIDMAKSGSDRTVTTMMRGNVIVKDEDAGEEVTYVLGKEMYRVTDFCTFDVGPYSATTRIRAGETRMDAFNRLRAELETVAEADRITRRDSYIRTYLGIKPELQKAADAKREG